MRMFGYYAFHSFLNQIRKLLKTWVLIFLIACILLGGLIGFGAAVLFDDDEAEAYASDDEEYEEYEDEYEEDWEEEDGFFRLDEGGNLLLTLPWSGETLSMTVHEAGECVAALVLLALLLFFVLSAQTGGGKLFLMADVNLLFASPMKPQSVLLFRLVTKLGLLLILTIYLGACYMPLLLDSGLVDAAGEMLLFLVWFLAIAYCQLLQVLTYTLTATHPERSRRLRPILYGICLAALAGYAAFWRAAGSNPLGAAVRFLSLPALRVVPVWGWLKGMTAALFAGNYVGSLLWAALSAVGLVLLVFLIWHLKADFYEDAMTKSEEVAALQQAVKEKGSLFTVSKKKREEKAEGETDEKKKKRRPASGGEGFSHGAGASVFFFRAMHNRYRFARLHYFTKTCELYLAFTLIAAIFSRFVLSSDWFYPMLLGLAAAGFFRAIGNPVEEDTGMDFFRLIPEPGRKKLFYSILGCETNYLLDLLPAMLVLAVYSMEPVTVLLWMLIIITVHIYATTVGCFIHLSVPVSAGMTVKQLAQVMFIYFGLLPDIGIIAAGFVMEAVGIAALAAAVLNILLALLFTGLTARYLDPSDGKRHRARKAFSRAGWAAVFLYLCGSVAQTAVLALMGLSEGLADRDTAMWLGTFLPLYLVGFPVGLLVIRKLPRAVGNPQEEGRRFTIPEMIKLFLIMVFLGYAGNILGTILTTLIGLILPSAGYSNVLESYIASDSILLKILFMVILAPIMEELFFRRAIIDRIRPYGEKTAVIFSALVFGLFHGNLTQSIYAFALGLVLGYVYLRSGKLRYSAALHMAFNFMGSILAGTAEIWLEEDMTALGLGDDLTMDNIMALSTSRGMIAFGAFMLALGVMFIAGLILFLKNRKKVRFDPAERELPPQGRVGTVCLNPGMLVFILMMLAIILMVLFVM